MEGALKLARAYSHEKTGGRGAENPLSGAGEFLSWPHVWGAFDHVPGEISRRRSSR